MLWDRSLHPAVTTDGKLLLTSPHVPPLPHSLPLPCLPAAAAHAPALRHRGLIALSQAVAEAASGPSGRRWEAASALEKQLLGMMVQVWTRCVTDDALEGCGLGSWLGSGIGCGCRFECE